MFTVLTPRIDPRPSLDRTLAVVTSTDSHESIDFIVLGIFCQLQILVLVTDGGEKINNFSIL